MMYNNTNNTYLWSQQLSEEERKALYYLISKTIDELKSEERKDQTTTTLYADNIPVCEVIDDKPYWYKEVQCEIEDRQKTVDELKTKLEIEKLNNYQQAQRDAILSSLNMPPRPTYNNYYPDEIKKCPICGRDPEVIHHEAYDVYDIQCISKILKTPHLFVFGIAEESKKDVVDRWNKLVLEYEIDQEDNDHPCWLRRYF